MSESQSGQPPSAPSPESVASRRDAEQQTRIAASPFELSQEPVTPEGPADPSPPGIPAPAYEHLGELPSTYGTQSVYLVAYDPRQLFAYWDVDWVAAGGAGFALHVCRADGELEGEVAISGAEAGRYLAIGRPGGTYYVELGRHARDGSWQPLAFSGRVTMPPEGLSGETEPKFATLPFHLSFQRLLELIQGTMGQGENLTAALARLQRGTHPAATASLLRSLGHLDGEQIHTLEQLLGRKFGGAGLDDAGGSPGGMSSENAFLRDRQEVLSSGGGFGSEAPSTMGPGSETLSSGLLATGAGGSETLPATAFGSEHGTIHAPGAFGSEALSSGGLAAGGGSDTFSAFVAGLSGDTLSSYGLGSEMLAASGSGGSEILSSMSWQMLGLGVGPDSAGMDSERAEMFRRALGNDLDVLGALFSAVNSGLSSGFSPGASDPLA